MGQGEDLVKIWSKMPQIRANRSLADADKAPACPSRVCDHEGCLAWCMGVENAEVWRNGEKSLSFGEQRR